MRQNLGRAEGFRESNLQPTEALDRGTSVQWGASSDRPQPGDYDGNGTTDKAVFRPADTVWYVQAGTSAQWGAATDIQLSLPYAIRQVFFP